MTNENEPNLILLKRNTRYHEITFAGCGFLLSYHFGVVQCLLDNEITVDHAVGISGGAMAALSLLGGSDLYIGIRQAIKDLSNEIFGFILLGFNFFFMSYYFHYCWSFVCLRPTPAAFQKSQLEIASKIGSNFKLHDMNSRCKTGLELSRNESKLHVLAVAW